MKESRAINKSVVISVGLHVLVLIALLFSSDIKKIVSQLDFIDDKTIAEPVVVSYIEASKNPLKKRNSNKTIIKLKPTGDEQNKVVPVVPQDQATPDQRSKTQIADDKANKDKIVKLIKNPNPPEAIDYTAKAEKKQIVVNNSANRNDGRQLVQMPGNPKPSYPRANRIRNEQGTVVLKYLVTDDGTVNDIRVIQSSGYKRLDKEALNKVKNWKFKPGQAGETFHPIIFKLNGEGKKLPSRLRSKKQS